VECLAKLNKEDRMTRRLFVALLLAMSIIAPAAAQQTRVFISKQPGTVRVNAVASIGVSTSRNAKCTITVMYKNVKANARGLAPKTAGASGTVSWTWKIDSKTPVGTWPVTVTCNNVTAKTTVTIK
jgi:hypothetical protein